MPLRILRLWRLSATMDTLWVLRNASSAATYVLSDVVFSAAAIAAALLLAAKFDGIGRWTSGQVVFMVGYGMLANALVDTFFGFNLKVISRRIGRGQLDHVLIQPLPLWVIFCTEGFVPLDYPLVLAVAAGLMAWAGRSLQLPLSPPWAAALLISLLASSVVILAFQFLWGSIAFWAPRAAEEVNSSTDRLLNQLRPFPLDGTGLPAQTGLLTVIPVGFVAWFPCRALLGIGASPWELALTPAAALAFALLAVAAFRKGLRHYGRTGSQRYSSAGHRR